LDEEGACLKIAMMFRYVQMHLVHQFKKKAYANINRSPCGSKENLSLEIALSLPQDLRTVCSLLAPLLACLLFIIGMRRVELSRLRGSCSGVLGQLQSPSSLCMLQSLNLQ